MSEWKNVCTECWHKEELATLRQRVADCEGAIERREQIIAEANTERDSAKDAEVVAWGEVDRLQAANRDLQHWFDDARATVERLEVRVAKLKHLCERLQHCAQGFYVDQGDHDHMEAIMKDYHAIMRGDTTRATGSGQAGGDA